VLTQLWGLVEYSSRSFTPLGYGLWGFYTRTRGTFTPRPPHCHGTAPRESVSAAVGAGTYRLHPVDPVLARALRPQVNKVDTVTIEPEPVVLPVEDTTAEAEEESPEVEAALTALEAAEDAVAEAETPDEIKEAGKALREAERELAKVQAQAEWEARPEAEGEAEVEAEADE
jgi:hypothetical protein